VEAADARAIIEAVSDVEAGRTLRPQLYDFVYQVSGPDGRVRGRLVDCTGAVLTLGELSKSGTRNREVNWESIDSIEVMTSIGE
jgi:hypothetical protein